MSIESMMYFALGALATAIVALLILPAVWRRAVRLTRKRIEAATPMTLTEFRADKDQLRAEFALSTRRLEITVEALRTRLADQLSDAGRKKTDLAALKAERDQHMEIVDELAQHEAQLRDRILELERETSELAQRLAMRDRDYAGKLDQLKASREAIQLALPQSRQLDQGMLTGDYDEDIEELLTALTIEHKRANFLEEQTKGLITQLETLDKTSLDSNVAIARLRQSLARRDDETTDTNNDLVAAEIRIADAESRLNALLEQASQNVPDAPPDHDQLLAEKLSLETQVEHLREKVLSVETGVMADWDTERLEQAHLRERLNDIASDVSRLIYAIDGHRIEDVEESLFDRVQKFADDGLNVETIPALASHIPFNAANFDAGKSSHSAVSDRMAALREIQSRN